MKFFPRSKIFKVVALALVIIFTGQQLCPAQVTDLREEGEIGAVDVLFSLISGFLMGLSVMPGWSAMRTFTMAYLVPRGTSLLCDAAGIKNPYFRAAIQMGVSYTANTAFDLKSAATPATKSISDSHSANYATSTADMKYLSNTAAQSSRGSLAARFTGFFKNFFRRTDAGRNLLGPSASIWTASILKGVQGAAYGVAREYLYQNIKKYDKHLAFFVSTVGGAIIGEIAGAGLSKAFGINFGYDSQGRFAVKLQGAALTRGLQLEMRQFFIRELPMDIVAGGAEAGLAEVGMQEEGVRGIGSLISGFLGGYMNRNKYVSEYEKKPLQELAEESTMLECKLEADRYAVANGEAQDMLRVKEMEELNQRLQAIYPLMELRAYQRKQAIYSHLSKADAGDYFILQARENRHEPLNESDAVLKQWLDKEVARIPGAVNPGPEMGGPSLGEKLDVKSGDLDGSQINLYRSLIHRQQMGINEMRGSMSIALLNAVIAGGVSATLQYISSKTDSPVYGAYFNLFASTMLKYIFIKGTNLFRRAENGDLVSMAKDYKFFMHIAGASMTEALADMMSMGRARARINNQGTFDLDWLDKNDVWHMERMYNYIQDMEKNGMATALMNQLNSSLHYQAVKNVSETINGKVQDTYILELPRPSLRTWAAADSESFKLAEQADLSRPLSDLPKGAEVLSKDGALQGKVADVKEEAGGITITIQWNNFSSSTISSSSGNDAIKEPLSKRFKSVKFRGSYSDEISKLSGWRNYIPYEAPQKGMERAKEELDQKAQNGSITPQEEILRQALNQSLGFYYQDIKAHGAPGRHGLWKVSAGEFNAAESTSEELKNLPKFKQAREQEKERLTKEILDSEKGAMKEEIAEGIASTLAFNSAKDKLVGSVEASAAAAIEQRIAVMEVSREKALQVRLSELRQEYPGDPERVAEQESEIYAGYEIDSRNVEERRIEEYRKAAPAKARREYDKEVEKVKKEISEKVINAHRARAEQEAENKLNGEYMQRLSVTHDTSGVSLSYNAKWGKRPTAVSAPPEIKAPEMALENSEEAFKYLKELMRNLNLEMRRLVQEMRELMRQMKLDEMTARLNKQYPQPPLARASMESKTIDLPAASPVAKPNLDFMPVEALQKDSLGRNPVIYNPRNGEGISVQDMDSKMLQPRANEVYIMAPGGPYPVDAGLLPQLPVNSSPLAPVVPRATEPVAPPAPELAPESAPSSRINKPVIITPSRESKNNDDEISFKVGPDGKIKIDSGVTDRLKKEYLVPEKDKLPPPPVIDLRLPQSPQEPSPARGQMDNPPAPEIKMPLLSSTDTPTNKIAAPLPAALNTNQLPVATAPAVPQAPAVSQSVPADVPSTYGRAIDGLANTNQQAESDYNHPRRPDHLLDYTKLDNNLLTNLGQACKMLEDPQGLDQGQLDYMKDVINYVGLSKIKPDSPQVNDYLSGVKDELRKRNITLPEISKGKIVEPSSSNTLFQEGANSKTGRQAIAARRAQDAYESQKAESEINNLIIDIKSRMAELDKFKTNPSISQKVIEEKLTTLEQQMSRVNTLRQEQIQKKENRLLELGKEIKIQGK